MSILESLFKVVGSDKQRSRHHIQLYRSVHLETTFFGLKGMEPLMITGVALLCLLLKMNIIKIALGVVVVIGFLYWLRTHTKPYRFKQCLSFISRPKGVLVAQRDHIQVQSVKELAS